MAKQSGIGDNLYVGGSDLSGDTQSIEKISGPQDTIETTDITQGGKSRLGGQRDGLMDVTSYFDPAPLASHAVWSPLPTTDIGLMYCRGTALGNPAACLVAKQINYDGVRDDKGALAFKVESQANGFGLEWGRLLTAGKRTDVAATNGTGIDTLASAAFGAQAYLQMFAGFVGTDVTVKIQDSADNVTFADVAGFAFAQITTATLQTQRIAIANNATVRQYIRAATVTTGGFTSLTFAVVVVKNSILGQVF